MGELTYKAPPKVGQMLLSRAVIQGIIGPLGSGKSVGCVMKLVKHASMQPKQADGIRRSRYAVIRNTFRMLQDTTIKTVHEWLPPGPAGQWKEGTKTFKLKWGDVESEWMFRPLESKEDVRNLLSLEVTGAWINEYREIDPDVLINLLGRIGRYPRKMDTEGVGAVDRMVVMDSNPPPMGGYWHDLFEEPLDEATKQALQQAMGGDERPLLEYFRQPSGMSEEAENRENLPEGYYELLVAANKDQGQEWVDVHVHAEYGADPTGLPVYPEYRAITHKPQAPLIPDPNLPLVVGMDFGLTPAIAVLDRTARGQWRVLRELVSENTTVEQFMDAMMPWFRMNFPDHEFKEIQIWPDPSGKHRDDSDGKSCYAVLRSYGLAPRTPPQDLASRVGGVRRALTRTIPGTDMPGLIIDPSCRTIHKGMAGAYKIERDKSGDLKPKPSKDPTSHVMNALEYALAPYESPEMKGRPAPRFQNKHQLSKPIVKGTGWSVYDKS